MKELIVNPDTEAENTITSTGEITESEVDRILQRHGYDPDAVDYELSDSP